MNNNMKSAILLVENEHGDWEGIRFKSHDEARAWQDDHPNLDDKVRGVVRLVDRRDYLSRVYKHEPHVLEPCLPPEGYTGPWA